MVEPLPSDSPQSHGTLAWLPDVQIRLPIAHRMAFHFRRRMSNDQTASAFTVNGDPAIGEWGS